MIARTEQSKIKPNLQRSCGSSVREPCLILPCSSHRKRLMGVGGGGGGGEKERKKQRRKETNKQGKKNRSIDRQTDGEGGRKEGKKRESGGGRERGRQTDKSPPFSFPPPPPPPPPSLLIVSSAHALTLKDSRQYDAILPTNATTSSLFVHKSDLFFALH